MPITIMCPQTPKHQTKTTSDGKTRPTLTGGHGLRARRLRLFNLSPSACGGTKGGSDSSFILHPSSLLSVREVGPLLGLKSPRTIRRIMREEIGAVQRGRFLRVRARDLAAYVDRNFHPSLASIARDMITQSNIRPTYPKSKRKTQTET